MGELIEVFCQAGVGVVEGSWECLFCELDGAADIEDDGFIVAASELFDLGCVVDCDGGAGGLEGGVISDLVVNGVARNPVIADAEERPKGWVELGLISEQEKDFRIRNVCRGSNMRTARRCQ